MDDGATEDTLTFWLSLALAGPYQMLAPASTLDLEHTEMGAGIGYSAAVDALGTGAVALGGWGRYGILERVEVGGGGLVPFRPVDLVVYGGARVQPLGPAGTEEGIKGTLGAFVGTQVWAIGLPSAAATASLGYRARQVEVFVQPQVGVVSLPFGASASQWGVEGGMAILAAGFPIYLSATYGGVGDVGVFVANAGGGFDLAM